MKSKPLFIVLGVAAASVVAAYVALSRGGGATAVDRTGEPFAAGLEALAPALDRIELERGGRRIELRRAGDAWTVASSDGYPARFEQVKVLVSGLSTLKTEQRMTAKPERHAELGLAWPDAEGRGAR
ncbi:MAG: hypothetical protein ACKO0W_00420, partial [Planctomycetota bacterium]